jgi:hypothetical protein
VAPCAGHHPAQAATTLLLRSVAARGSIVSTAFTALGTYHSLRRSWPDLFQLKAIDEKRRVDVELPCRPGGLQRLWG